jgi:hypothetical protein
MQQTFATCKPLIGPGGLFAAKLTDVVEKTLVMQAFM